MYIYEFVLGLNKNCLTYVLIIIKVITSHICKTVLCSLTLLPIIYIINIILYYNCISVC